jgi:predicted neuraminidase
MREQTVCGTDVCPNEFPFHKNSTICELPDGSLVAAWFAGHEGEGYADQAVYGSHRPADSDEWETPECWVDVPNKAVGCPVLFIGPDENLWLTAPVNYGAWVKGGSRLFFKRSEDDGQTWKDLELLSDVRGVYLKNKPLHLAEVNRWILPAYYEDFSDPCFFLIEEDFDERPREFPRLVGADQIPPHDPEFVGVNHTQGLSHPTVVELSDGSLLAYLRPRTGGYIYETRSHDRGETWTEAEQTDIPNPNAGFDMVRTAAGNIVLANNPQRGENPPEGRNNLELWLSEDEGNSWPFKMTLRYEEADLQPGNVDQGQPTFTYSNIIQADDGTLHVLYEQRRQSIQHVEITEEELREQSQ